MYHYERNSRVYMKGDGDQEKLGPARSASRSPLQEIAKNEAHHRSQTLHHVNGHDCPTTNGKTTPTHHSQTKPLKDTTHRAVSSELGELTAPGEHKTKTQMARAFQESQELYKSADSKAGLQTVKTRRVLKKTTTITRGENEKLEDDSKVREEMIRRIDEYKSLARSLLQWLKESTGKLEDRNFPKSIPELKKLRDDTERFRCEEVPPKHQEKQRLASMADEIFKFADELQIRLDDDICMDNINHKWDKMMSALKARGKALDDELAKAERLKHLLDKLLNEINKTNARMDAVERDINEEERRVSRIETLKDAEQFSPAKLQRISEELGDIGIKIDSIKRLADDFINEAGRSHPDSIMVREKVAELDGRYKKLLAKLAGLQDEYERVINRLRELEDMRRAQARKEAEAKLRLKLDAMKRELDELERRVDNMGPVSRDPATLKKQLEELRQFDLDLARARNNLNDLIRLAEGLIKDDLIADPPALRAELQTLKDQLKRIEDKAARLLRDFEDALRRADQQKKALEEITMKLDDIKKRLDELERRLDNMAPVAKDLATLQLQLAELQDFERDLTVVRNNLNDAARLAEDMIRDDLIADPAALRANIKSLKDQVARIDDKMNRRMKAILEGLKRADAQKAAEAKYRLRLDDMQRELDEQERKLRNMGPISKDVAGLQQQLAEINDFIEKFQDTKRKLADLLKAGEDLIRDDMIADPATLRADMKKLKEQCERIEKDAIKRLRDIQDAMSRVAASDAIGEVAKFLERAKRVLLSEEKVHGDLDTVSALIEQHKSFEQEVAAQQPAIQEVRRMEQELSNTSPQNGALIREELAALSNQWREIEKLTREKSAKLDEALRAAEQLHQSVHVLLEWLADAETKLRFNADLADDEQAARQDIADHETMVRKMATQEQTKGQTLKLAQDILAKCHPDAEPVIKHWINIIESRWDEIDAWAKQRGQRLSDHLRSLQEVLQLVDELIGWLSRHESRLLAEESEPLPENVGQLDALVDQHSKFMEELRKREPQVDRVVKIFASKSGNSSSKVILTTTTTKPAASDATASSGRLSAGARSATPTRTSYATYRDEYPQLKQARGKLMLEKWRSVWQLALDKMQRLKDRAERLKELGRLEDFDLDDWSRRFMSWVSSKNGPADFFRSIDDNNDGRIPVDAFIGGVLRARFETSRLEMERVADLMDKNHDGQIDSKEFLDSLRPDHPLTDDELIQDEIQRQVSNGYRVYHVGGSRYRFGESQKLRLVKILRSMVMVRVGGGWEPLASFLQKNNPRRDE